MRLLVVRTTVPTSHFRTMFDAYPVRAYFLDDSMALLLRKVHLKARHPTYSQVKLPLGAAVVILALPGACCPGASGRLAGPLA